MKKIFVCSDSIEGLFSAIYEAWKSHLRDGIKEYGIRLEGYLDTEMFCEYVLAEGAEKKVQAVERLIMEHLGWYAYKIIYQAAMSTDPMKGDAILATMFAAKEIPNSRRIMEHLSHPQVGKVVKLAKNVGEEAHLWTGFLRFQELENGVLFSEFKPKNRVMTYVAPHFADRLSVENWIIYDETHDEYAVHEAGKQWVLASNLEIDREKVLCVSEKEQLMQDLWKEFRNTIAIKERKNPKCQLQHMPLWYRNHMVEFAD